MRSLESVLVLAALVGALGACTGKAPVSGTVDFSEAMSRIDGVSEMEPDLRASLTAALAYAEQRANEGDMATAELILDGAGLTVMGLSRAQIRVEAVGPLMEALELAYKAGSIVPGGWSRHPDRCCDADNWCSKEGNGTCWQHRRLGADAKPIACADTCTD